MKLSKRIVASILALALALGLASCGGNVTDGSAESSQGSANTTSSLAAEGDLVGKPWISSYIIGNLPAKAPAAKDDAFTHYNYEFLANNQERSSAAVAQHAGELQDSIVAIIGDKSQTGHDLEQLRIFYNQAVDENALKSTGLSEVQPYLKRVEAVSSIEDLNALMTDKDFPFMPFVQSTITTVGMRGNNVVKVNANLLFTDVEMFGGQYYQDGDDEQTRQSNQSELLSNAIPLVTDLMAQGMSEEEAKTFAKQVLATETVYGKHVDYDARYASLPYGSFAQASFDSVCTYDELIALFSNMPMEGILDKLNKLGSEKYKVTKEWAKALNDMWTDENLDALKDVVKATVLMETMPYRDQSGINEARASLGAPPTDAAQNAYAACDKTNTLSQIIAKLYVYNTIGQAGKERLEKLTHDLLGSYKELFEATTWMSDESKKNAIEKLETMRLNVLEPEEGYFDYSALNLTTTEDGGTLLGNYFKLKQYRYDCESKLINQPASGGTTLYNTAPTTMNAFYNADNNSINVCPGFITSLTYTDEMADVDLISGVGGVIGHEISHGFDFDGSQFNAYAENESVYAGNDLDSFLAKTKKLEDYYNTMEIVPGTNVDGQYVIVEAASDLSGMQAILVLMDKLENPDYDRFFSHFSEMYAATFAAESLPSRLTDTHPLNNLRVNVNAQMFESVYDALGISQGDGMYLAPKERIILWGVDA